MAIMNNIHGLRDQRQGLLDQSQKTDAILLSGYSIGTADEARRETFFGMLKSVVCPYFNTKSFTSIICIVNIAFYILCILSGKSSKGRSFLQPSLSSLIAFGAKDSARIHKGEFWRWLSPVFLHNNLTHLCLNSIMILFVVSRLEHSVEYKLTMIIYFVSAVGGNLLSVLLNSSSISVGASSAVFGCLLSMIGWILFNWSSLQGNPRRNRAIFILGIIAFLNFTMGTFGKQIDNWGHFGGVITGFGLGFCVMPKVDNGYNNTLSVKQKFMKNASIGFLALYFIGGIAGFYFY